MILASLAGWYSFWQVATLISLALTFIAGLGTFTTAKSVNERQAEENRKQAKELLQLRKDVSSADQKSAEANARAAEANKIAEEERLTKACRRVSAQIASRHLILPTLILG